MDQIMSLAMFGSVCLVLLAGYPVAFSLAGTALGFALFGGATGLFDLVFLQALPNRLYSTMTNDTLIAVPLFIFMGVLMERARIAESLLDSMAMLFGRLRGGLGVSVMLVGVLMAASTGIVGATVVTMGLLSLPTLLKRGYSPSLAAGTIAAAGTLGQIIPPSIILVLLGDVISTAYQQAQLQMGNFAPKSISVGDLFLGALVPGLMLVGLYIIYLLGMAWFKPETSPAMPAEELPSASELLWKVSVAMLPPLLLIVMVLGSIIAGAATPTEAASVGAVGALLLAAIKKELNLSVLQEVMRSTTRISSMVFLILIAASVFSLVFRGYGGDEVVRDWLTGLPGGVAGAMIAVMLVMFLLGFVLDFIEITFVVVPIVGPLLLGMGLDPIWLGIMIALNLQTSFLTPPFGFALFYLRGVAPPTISTSEIYRGVVPYIVIQVIALGLIALFPALVTWLPGVVFG